MSYDIELQDPITKAALVLDFPHQMKGGTYALGGTNIAELNITYNYSEHYRRVIGKHGIREIYGLSGAESIPILTQAINELDDDVSSDYWEPTEGNAKKALIHILALAQIRPDGIWTGN